MSARADLPAVDQMLADTLSPATKRAYDGHWRRFRAWLDGREPDDRLLAEWLRSLHDAGCAPATVGQAASAACWREDGAQPLGPLARATLKWIRLHGAGRGRGQATGVTWDDVDRAAAAAADQGLAGLRDAAILSVASWALLRVSEIAALDVSDIEAEGPQTVLVRRSKTDQLAVGTVLFLGAATEVVFRWTTAAQIVEGPLFRPVHRSGSVLPSRLTTDSVRAVVKRRLADVGIKAGVSGHSLRIGSAQALTERGATLPELMVAGRWKSDRMPAHYTRGMAARKGAMARLRT